MNRLHHDQAQVTPGAAQAIAYHNHHADQAHRQAQEALCRYNAAMIRLQQALLEEGYQHRNSAAIAAGIAAGIGEK
jgi:hypothetical protein